MFEPIQEEILYAEFPDYKNEIEKEHIPHITHNDGHEIEITVGEELHGMEEDHRITSLELYDEYGDRIDEIFFDERQDPVHVFDISDLDFFEVRSICNVHGVWSTGLLENKNN